MKQQELTLYQVIAILNKLETKDKKFYRVGDSEANIVLCSEYYMPSDFVCIYEKTLTTTLDKNSRKIDTEKLFIHKKLYEKIKDNIIIKTNNRNN